MRGLVFNIQRYCVSDGPGIRTTAFLKGCPLSCWWCHNPESRDGGKQVIVVEPRCIRCGACSLRCPSGMAAGAAIPAEAPHPALSPEYRGEGDGDAAHRGEGDGAAAHRGEGDGAAAHRGEGSDRCRRCGECVDACPTGARQMVGREMEVGELMVEILKDRVFFQDSGGGVTFSGGEPFVQFDFLMAMLEECKRRGIHTAVDTCGFTRRARLLAAAPLVDLFLYDLKLVDDQKHQRYTGVSNVSILENLRALCEAHGNVWIRVPVIPGINDGAEMDAIAGFVASVKTIRRVNLLAYHRTGVAKAARVGEEYKLDEVEAPDAAKMEAVAEVFQAAGLTVRIGG